MKRLPPLTGLKAFEAAARLMSFKDAADELAVTPTAVSHQIRQLEADIGEKLFVRGGRSVDLTSAGRLLYPDVHEAFALLHRAAGRLQPEPGCRLTVSTVASFAVKWLIPRLGKFQDLHPDMDVRITTDMKLVDFERDDVDLAIRYGTGQWPGLRVDRLMSEDWRPVASPELAARIPLETPADLANHTLLHHSNYPDDWQRWLRMAGYPELAAARHLTFDDSAAGVQAAINGLGVALGRRAYSDADIAAGTLIEPFDIHFPQETAFYIVAPETRADEKAIAAFRDWILAEVPPD